MPLSSSLDLVLSVALSASLIVGGGISIWLLPWSEEDQEGTLRAMASLARRLGDGARMPLRAVALGR